VVAPCQLAFALLRKVAQQQVRHGERQHPVAQELQPLVAVREGRLQRRLAVERAAMGQRLGNKLGPRECMSEARRQRRQSGVAWSQWIAWKKRLKRIACGHFHGSSHPAAEGSWEKKMNSARPTRFSAGTYQPSSSRVRMAPLESRICSWVRLSSESSRLSPMAKYCPAGTRNSGVLSDMPLSVVSRISCLRPLGRISV